tara:strand:- start:36 stop:878 length:843 start_codon:yes stop_codon:yes gene_type:complete
MSWENISGNAVSEQNLLELAKEEVRQRIENTQKRHRAHLCTLLYGEAKCGKSGLALDSRTVDQIDKDCLVMVLDFDNGCEPTWRQNWNSDPNIQILNPIVRDSEGYPNLDETIRLSEAFIQMAKDEINTGKEVKFVFDGLDRWLRLCFLVMTDDKRSMQQKFMPLLWGKRNKAYEELIEKITDGLECDRFFITHMKEVYEGINNPTPTGKIPNIRPSTMDKMNQVFEVSRVDVGNTAKYTAKLKDSKTNNELINQTWEFLTIANSEVNWASITELQDGSL